jgi:mRNA interferase RelE/StbE
MDLYKIIWKNSSVHDIKNIERPFIPGILDKIEALTENPLPYNSKKIIGSTMSFRIRIGKYRVIYQVNFIDKIITIFHVRHRKDVYKR